jgi:hypothetical protein
MYSSNDTDDLVGAIVFGPPGGGKSGMLSTFGVKTIYFMSDVEAQGRHSARIHKNCEIDFLNFERHEVTGEKLSPAKALESLGARLSDVEWFRSRGYKAVVVDSVSELEALVVETPAWRTKTTDKNGETKMYTDPITIAMITPFLAQLRNLQAILKIHYAVTALLDVKRMGEAGEILEGTAKSRGYGVLFHLLVSFPDRFILGHMSPGPNAKKLKPRIQIDAQLSRVAKEFAQNGAPAKVSKVLNLRTKVAGCDMSTFPNTMAPDFSRIIACKRAGKFVKSNEIDDKPE